MKVTTAKEENLPSQRITGGERGICPSGNPKTAETKEEMIMHTSSPFTNSSLNGCGDASESYKEIEEDIDSCCELNFNSDDRVEGNLDQDIALTCSSVSDEIESRDSPTRSDSNQCIDASVVEKKNQMLSSSPEIVRALDPKSIRRGRRAELEELRQKHLAKQLRNQKFQQLEALKQVNTQQDTHSFPLLSPPRFRMKNPRNNVQFSANAAHSCHGAPSSVSDDRFSSSAGLFDFDSFFFAQMALKGEQKRQERESREFLRTYRNNDLKINLKSKDIPLQISQHHYAPDFKSPNNRSASLDSQGASRQDFLHHHYLPIPTPPFQAHTNINLNHPQSLLDRVESYERAGNSDNRDPHIKNSQKLIQQVPCNLLSDLKSHKNRTSDVSNVTEDSVKSNLYHNRCRVPLSPSHVNVDFVGGDEKSHILKSAVNINNNESHLMKKESLLPIKQLQHKHEIEFNSPRRTLTLELTGKENSLHDPPTNKSPIQLLQPKSDLVVSVHDYSSAEKSPTLESHIATGESQHSPYLETSSPQGVKKDYSELEKLSSMQRMSPMSMSPSLSAEQRAIRLHAQRVLIWAEKAGENSSDTSTTASSRKIKGHGHGDFDLGLPPRNRLPPQQPFLEVSKDQGEDKENTGECHRPRFSNKHDIKVKRKKICTCSKSVFSGNSANTDFFLPKLGLACSCGAERGDYFYDTIDPTDLTRILRPWQIDFLKSVKILNSKQLIEAQRLHPKRIAKAMKIWRKEQEMKQVSSKSCYLALLLWTKTAKNFINGCEHSNLNPNKNIQNPILSETNCSQDESSYAGSISSSCKSIRTTTMSKDDPIEVDESEI